MTKELRTNDGQNKPDNASEGSVISQSYAGPIPPASEFEKYEAVLPGAADRILTMAEGQSQHRYSLERFVARAAVWSSFLGTLSALVIVLVGFAAGTYLIISGFSAAGLSAVFVPLASIVGTFLWRERSRDDEN